LFIALLVITVCIFVYFFFSRRDVEKQLQEYKTLFEVADALQKEAPVKIEALLVDANEKNLLLERSAQTLELTSTELEKTKTEHAVTKEELVGAQTQLRFQEEQYAKLFGQKKSSEVRTGKITEQISPFLNDYPLSPATARFIGDPIDFVHFDEDKVSFVEVKSGKSQLSKKQRHIRDLVKDGKVEFVIYRVEGK
jgi:predicted Holliday junction resolvase-like endonuclease